ncbi:MAG TPA: PIG-L deacetylase family protein [Dehalococcoidia bacterium]|jgi:N-acetyl-1-D-myo-inositol-2-amino-2-deoxy-alpha-D-glucopyranoside deacetylase|nr:PIG-L deacetylase family protein [Dehalococcoidia bacterium]
MPAGLRVLGIFPHPDDESYSCGGTLSRLAADGAAVHVLCATSGEGGQYLREGAPPADIGTVRRGELACACQALGIEPPRFLGLPDGRVGEVDFVAAAGAIVRELRLLRPHLVLSLGSDGVYGHPDHLALHRLVVASFAAAGGGERFPEEQFGPAWQPYRFFAAAFPRGMFRPMYDHMLSSEYTTAIRGLDPEKLGVEPAEVAAAIDIHAFAERKLQAIRCHASQLRGGDPETLFPGDLVRRTLSFELFTLVFGESVPHRLADLAEGVPV